MRQIYVVAGLLQRPDAQILLDRRRRGTHLEGLWEFPGGKREPGETDHAALIRELREELGVEVTEVGERVAQVVHAYADVEVTLVLYAVTWRGQPEAREVAEVRWFAPSELRALPMPPADGPLVEAVLERAAGA